jgi:hypothetical protein
MHVVPEADGADGESDGVLEDDMPMKLFGGVSFQKDLSLLGYAPSVCSLVGGESGRLYKLGLQECCGL